MAMVLKPQDIVVLLKLVAINASDWSYNSLANDLAMSPAEVHAGIKRCALARLFDQQRNAPIRSALLEFLVHGVKYVFLPDRGALTRGIPTGYAAPPLNSLIVQTNEPSPVWPSPEGTIRGYEFSPLYKSVPKAVTKDSVLYELLALVDAIRDGRARERDLAVKELTKRLELVS
jgi:hypothetical protein